MQLEVVEWSKRPCAWIRPSLAIYFSALRYLTYVIAPDLPATTPPDINKDRKSSLRVRLLPFFKPYQHANLDGCVTHCWQLKLQIVTTLFSLLNNTSPPLYLTLIFNNFQLRSGLVQVGLRFISKSNRLDSNLTLCLLLTTLFATLGLCRCS